jgi:hypothetical protein
MKWHYSFLFELSRKGTTKLEFWELHIENVNKRQFTGPAMLKVILNNLYFENIRNPRVRHAGIFSWKRERFVHLTFRVP